MAAKHEDVRVAEELVKIGKEQADVEIAQLKSRLEAAPWIYEMLGKIKTLSFTEAQSKFFKIVMLKQVKDNKIYREKFGMTWEQFCETAGVNRRRIDEQLDDLKPFKAEFLAEFANFSGLDFSKIKYLGDSKLADSANFSDNAIVFNGETIPVTPEHAEEIQALLENLEERHKQLQQEKHAELQAAQRIAKAKEDVIKKMEREIKRLERTVDFSDLTPEEIDGFELLRQIQGDMVQAISTIKQKIDYKTAPESVLRQLYFLFIFGSKIYMEERMILNDVYADAEDVPWEITEQELPPADVLVDNLPLTKGMGKAYKEKIEKRKK